ncbi:hypothetical protein ATI61_104665 [Archangium gephyra]|uniref:Uncharacterized protein n=1 Tax=Archangium gephyra TaxID=48 RepID=A0AAC8Q2Q1_9BACT|nr:hypothetical protein [Archangium gephyra]AKI99913.1 Hypothetical protein AA314_01540 [Archangium gephyra]REG33374.1 hypothetical protein ATI61_104665 [Archangium gephyra]
MRLRTGLAVGVMLGAGVGVAGSRSVLREEARVKVDGVTERWRLEWRTPPELGCFETGGVSCPCEGFAQGERGELELVRARPGRPAERLPLTPLFGPSAPGEAPPQALLRGWKPASDDEYLDPDERLRVLQRRKRVRAMVLGDYDHDGQAREFVLQTQAYGCGLREAVLIGVDRRDGRVRALGTAEHPDTPLVLEPETWALLRGSARIESVETPCGDHGSELERVLRVHADEKGLHATSELYQCTDTGRGALDSSEVL